MVTMNMRDEYGLDAGNIMAKAAQSGQRRWWCVDDVATIKHRKGMLPTVGKECISSAQHGDMVGHAWTEVLSLLVPIGARGWRWGCEVIPTMI